MHPRSGGSGQTEQCIMLVIVHYEEQLVKRPSLDSHLGSEEGFVQLDLCPSECS